MNQEKINWDDDTKNAIQGLLNNIGLVEEQSLRIVDEIEKSLEWNEGQELFSDEDMVMLDGTADDETCIDCLIKMKQGTKSVSYLKEIDQWNLSPHANCRCNISYETRMTMNKQKHINNLIQDFMDNHK